MNSLFNSDPIHLNLPDADITYFPNFLSKTEADVLFQELMNNTPWQHDYITVYGKKHLQPRLTALYGNEGKPYSYSNFVMQPLNWTLPLQKIKVLVENITENKFTTVLLNHYRDGNDSNGWHADDEKELGINPIIASLSIGTERVFKLKHKINSDLKMNIILEHGSLLLMKGATQHFWKHQVPKTTKPIGPRINLTFRFIK
ncbi:alpha-ketoglutarate-dependent dioxygenase AlkB [Flavobacterium sp. IMCC34518]|uniref:alpha-ketoglutarate-dependent dioxygenase AlkB family protein n=1 Tax=Flavobacterium sp. IMCC34518 TaxID=3003623 RepID=UPI002482F4F5|nr:alpha-ketoglutarate-dependent dioxygenase AlkB [Flavobacterium sp. IMCC34518]